MALSEDEEFELLSLEREKAMAGQKRPPMRGGASSVDAAAIPIPGMSPMGARPEALSLPAMSGAEGQSGFQVPEIVKNAGREIVDMAKGLPMAAVAGFQPPSRTLGDPGQFMETVKGMGRDLKQEVTHPLEALQERPIQTISDASMLLSAGAKGAQLAGKAAGGVGKAAIATTLGPSMKDISRRLERTAEIQKALPSEELAVNFADTMTKFGKEVSAASDAALEKLSTSKYMMEGAKAKDALIGAIKSAKKSLGRATSDAAVSAKKQLDKYAARLKGLRETASEREVGAIIRDLDNDISWNSEVSEVGQNAIKNVRRKIDRILKEGNPEYKASMQDVEAKTVSLERAVKQFGLKWEKGEDGRRVYSPTNSTVTSLEGVDNKKRVRSRAVLNRLKEQVGKDYARAAENTKTAEAFEGGRAQGSRRVNLGMILGGGAADYLLGGSGVPGAMAGGMAGAYLDTKGASIAGKMIDVYAAQRPALTQIQKLLEAAKKPGRRAVPLSLYERLSSAGAY